MDIDAFILIGGRSSRFGTDKAFVEFCGETLAERAIRCVTAGIEPSRISLVIASEDQFSTDALARLGVDVVTDSKPGFGAWSGLHTALSNATSGCTFVLACDLPHVSAELMRLIAHLAAEDADAVVPRQPDGRLQPLCALYRVRTWRDTVQEFLTGPGDLPPLTSLFDRLKTRVVQPEEYRHLPDADRSFHNINTPADLAAAYWNEVPSSR